MLQVSSWTSASIGGGASNRREDGKTEVQEKESAVTLHTPPLTQRCWNGLWLDGKCYPFSCFSCSNLGLQKHAQMCIVFANIAQEPSEEHLATQEMQQFLLLLNCDKMGLDFTLRNP